MTKIILVRHCESQGNTSGKLQGRTDCDVSGNGAIQLDLLSIRLRNVPIDALYSSPLRRAYKTAEAINRYHGLEIHVVKELSEIDVGVWEGKTWAEVAEERPDEFRIWGERPEEFDPEGGESMRQVYDRIWLAVTKIARENPGKTVCIASHGCVIRNFLCRALGKPIIELNDIDWCDNTGISVVEFDEEMHSNVIKMNDASHIPADLSVYRRQGEGEAPQGIAP